jgi:hypothetical protein
MEKEKRGERKVKKIIAAFLVMLIFAFSNGGNMKAQEVGDIDIEDEGGTDYFEPSDDELVSLLTASRNPNAVVGPLIKTKWGQGAPFNNLFPMVSGRRKLTDCGNTARAQIMAFHRHPARGSGSSTKIGPGNITVPSVNFNVLYDWDNMLNTYRSDGRDSNERQRNAVATLMYHAAAGKGTNLNNMDALVTFFGYDKSIRQLDRRFYTDPEWEAIIKQQLDQGLPVLYNGKNPGSHAFIVDGYDSTGRFHINWGWKGEGDGWYSLNNFNPRGTRKYIETNLITINIKPDAGGSLAPYEMASVVFTASKTTVSRNESFTVSNRSKNIGRERYPGGQAGTALVDNNGNIVAIIGERSAGSLNAGSTGTLREMTCTVPNTVSPGRYRLQIVTKPNNGEWRLITRSAVRDGIPSSIEFTVR